MFLVELIKRTPTYVWIILAVLIKRGLSSAKGGMISLPKMMVIPVIFMVWGLEKLLTRFDYLEIALVFYIVTAGIGTAAAYALYSRFRMVYKKDGVFYRTGTYLPMVIMMINFLVKYISNVALSIVPALYGNLNFNIFYAVISGFSVGLFIGGIYQAFVACRQYNEGSLSTYL